MYKINKTVSPQLKSTKKVLSGGQSYKEYTNDPQRTYKKIWDCSIWFMVNGDDGSWFYKNWLVHHIIVVTVFVSHTKTAESIFHDLLVPGRLSSLQSASFSVAWTNCLTRGWHWQKTAATQNDFHSSLYYLCSSHIHSKCCYAYELFLDGFLLWPGNYLPAVALGRGRGGGALVNRCGGLVDWRGAPLLRAHGAAVVASLVVLVVRHGGHRLAPWTSLSTGPRRSGASSDTFSHSLLAVHLKNKRSGSYTIASTLYFSFYRRAVVYTSHRATLLLIKRHLV